MRTLSDHNCRDRFLYNDHRPCRSIVYCYTRPRRRCLLPDSPQYKKKPYIPRHHKSRPTNTRHSLHRHTPFDRNFPGHQVHILPSHCRSAYPFHRMAHIYYLIIYNHYPHHTLKEYTYHLHKTRCSTQT